MTLHLPAELHLRAEAGLRRAVAKQADGCWMWTRTLSDSGYGRICLHYRQYQAHRVAYELWVGPIPDGLQLDHLCRVRACVNPAHLEPVDLWTNVVGRGIGHTAVNARKTHCINGHPFDDENTYISPNRGWRSCRICRAAGKQRRMARLAVESVA